jgi:Spy/CpxP family protein refolding chaperone
MKKTLLALSLVTVLILGVTYVYAQGLGYGPGRGPGWKGERCWESETPGKFSSLTPEQKTKFQELRRRFNDETAQLRGALVTKRLELQSLWTNPNAESKTIMDKEKELRDLQNQMKDKSLQMKLEARKILTPEQIEEFGQGWGKGSGFGPGHMGGYGHRFGHGYRMGPESGYGMGPEYGMGPGYGFCR